MKIAFPAGCIVLVLILFIELLRHPSVKIYLTNSNSNLKYTSIEKFDRFNNMISEYENQNCQPKRFVYLKIHKTGSSLIRVIFRHFASHHGFEMNLMKRPNGFHIGGYPAPFNATVHKFDNKTDVIYDHMRFNKPEILKVLKYPQTPEKTVFVTSIREPVSHFLSSFHYFYGQYSEEIIDHSYNHPEQKRKSDVNGPKGRYWFYTDCHYEPYKSIFKGRGRKNVTEFVDLLMEKTGYSTPNLNVSDTDVKNFLSSLPDNRKILNLQSSELNYLKPNQVLEQMDFVIILERLPECLILLRYYLCGKTSEFDQYVSSVSNQRAYDKSIIFNQQQKKFINKFLINQDQELYKAANEKLDFLIEQYGKGKMEHELKDISIRKLEKELFSSQKREEKYRKMLKNAEDAEKLTKERNNRQKRSPLSNSDILRKIEDNPRFVELVNLHDDARSAISQEQKCGLGYGYDRSKKGFSMKNEFGIIPYGWLKV